MKKIIFILLIICFCFSDYANKDNWSKWSIYNKIIKKEKKKKKIRNICLIILGGTAHAFVISSTVRYYKRYYKNN